MDEQRDQYQGDSGEVNTLREITRPFTCCGKPMRKFDGVSQNGRFRTRTYSCDKCGTQKKAEPERI